MDDYLAVAWMTSVPLAFTLLLARRVFPLEVFITRHRVELAWLICAVVLQTAHAASNVFQVPIPYHGSIGQAGEMLLLGFIWYRTVRLLLAGPETRPATPAVPPQG